ncbi:MAG TPA: phosphate/phosphite/phosphonate ABC transporter substrate-binding protein [Opitutaceae bacterium]|nr:phosphate/phosphite/phosphonate ABC transporter substrate-binding protein [Opitutaceae bacterium]HRJ47510.1 phosphate/phosphite/phosphonate ABC transporter substrate-binding protein [Opitutaceae bacterium]
MSLRSTLILACAVFLLTACSRRAEPETGDSPKVIRLADTGIEGMEDLSRAYGPFVAELEKLTGVKVEFFPVSNRTAAVTALQFKQVDLILAGPSEYAAIASRLPVRPVVGIERPQYHTVFVVKADSPIQSLSDLKGRKIAMKDPGSTTGHIVPVWMLHRAGLDVDRDVKILLLDGARLEALVTGDVDALGSGVRDYEQLIKRFGPGTYRIIAQSEAMPNDLILAGATLSEAFVAGLRQQILAHGEPLMEAILGSTRRDRYAGSRFVAVQDSDYDVIREGYRILGLPLP